MALSEVDRRLRSLQRLTAVLLAAGVAVVVGFASFAVYEVVALRALQEQTAEQTSGLCDVLERAGILFEGTKENPCER